MEQENADSGSNVPEKVKCRFKAADGEYREGLCWLGKTSLEIQADTLQSIPY